MAAGFYFRMGRDQRQLRRWDSTVNSSQGIVNEPAHCMGRGARHYHPQSIPLLDNLLSLLQQFSALRILSFTTPGIFALIYGSNSFLRHFYPQSRLLSVH